MERVAFVIESSGDRLSCLLNPESLVLRRRAGLAPRSSAGGLVTGAELADDPIFFNGGGTTELILDLLFDVTLPGSSVPASDVRELTGPLWRLAENAGAGPEQGHPLTALFVWGKALRFRGVVAAVAERLEYFSIDGVPQRSWLRLRMLRVAESEADLEGGALPPPLLPENLDEPPQMPDGPSFIHTVLVDGTADAEASVDERLDLLAYKYYGDAAQWRVLAWLNDIADPLRLGGEGVIQVATRWDMEEPAP
jgi:Contractile injection system tube protein